MDIKEERAKEFEDLTEKLGFTPTFLANRWEVSRPTIYNWKKNGPPKYVLDYLRQTARMFGLPTK